MARSLAFRISPIFGLRGADDGPAYVQRKARTRRLGQGARIMKFFADTPDIAEILELAATGLLDGVTTNPTHISKTGRPLNDVIAGICSIVPGPISAEVVATDL